MNTAPLRLLARHLRRLAHRMHGHLLPWGFGLAALAIQMEAKASPNDSEFTADQNFRMAVEAQSESNYPEMMLLLRKSAEAGHVGAQEMLGTVLLVGHTLYGSAVSMDRCEAFEWMRLAAIQGSEVGKYQLTFLSRLRNAPSGKDTCKTASE